MTNIAVDLLSIIALLLAVMFIILTFKNKISFYAGLFSVTGALILFFVLTVLAVKLSTGVNIIDTTINQGFTEFYNRIKGMSNDAFASMYGSNIEKADMLSIIDTFKTAYTAVFPAIVIISSLFISFVVFMAIKGILGALKKDISRYPYFTKLKFPKTSAIVLGLSMILSIFYESYIGNAFLNIAVILLSVALVCGISYFCFIINKRFNALWVRILIYIFAFVIILPFFTFAPYLLVFIAISDSFFNFRRLGLAEDENGQE